MYKNQKGYPSTLALIYHMKIWVVVIGLIGLIIIIIWNVYTFTKIDPVEFEAQKQMKLELAKCIGSKSIIMYGSATCGHCIYQKQLFGADIFSAEITFIDCQRDKKVSCSDKNIEGYPTWIKVEDGKEVRSVGAHTLPELANFSGCPYQGY